MPTPSTPRHPDTSTPLPQPLLDPTSEAFEKLLEDLLDPACSLRIVAAANKITLTQLADWAEHPATARAIARLRSLARLRLAAAAEIAAPDALAALNRLLFDTPPDTARKAARQIITLRDADKPKSTTPHHCATESRRLCGVTRCDQPQPPNNTTNPSNCPTEPRQPHGVTRCDQPQTPNDTGGVAPSARRPARPFHRPSETSVQVGPDRRPAPSPPEGRTTPATGFNPCDDPCPCSTRKARRGWRIHGAARARDSPPSGP